MGKGYCSGLEGEMERASRDYVTLALLGLVCNSRIAAKRDQGTVNSLVDTWARLLVSLWGARMTQRALAATSLQNSKLEWIDDLGSMTKTNTDRKRP